MIRNSSWLRATMPLSGLEEVLVNFPKIGFLESCIYSLNEQDHIKTNTALLQSLFKQSAISLREVPSSGTEKEEF